MNCKILICGELKFKVIYVAILQPNKNKIYERRKIVAKDDVIEIDGNVIEALPNATFKVELDNKHVILCHIAGKMRMHYIKIMPGDRVKVELTPYSLDKGRIIYRHK